MYYYWSFEYDILLLVVSMGKLASWLPSPVTSSFMHMPTTLASNISGFTWSQRIVMGKKISEIDDIKLMAVNGSLQKHTGQTHFLHSYYGLM